MPTVLVVDDEVSLLDSLSRTFGREGLQVITAQDGKSALEAVRKQRVDVLLTDLMMPGGVSGIDLLKAARAVAPEAEVIVMTAYGSIEQAVEAMKEGAYDFVSKPLKRAHIVRVVRKALEKQSLVVENQALRAQLEATRRRSLVGASLPWRRTLEVVSQVAPSMATVLLLGESGTGKELLARAIHEHSPRAHKPFIAVNCSAIPESILEAELFGYERGAFTGAVARREGRFTLADGGTLFLDEIGELSPQVQVKLLRAIQEGEVERLGGRSVKIDIRWVTATNRDLGRLVREGRFREDLYYRLNVIAITIPPLRDRREDIPLLVEHFVQVFRQKNGKTIAGCTREALDVLERHSWPGNVRELENAIERAVVLCKSGVVTVEDLPGEVRGGGEAGEGHTLRIAVGTSLDEIERRVILETLRQTRGDKRLAAQLLGIATRTIYRKLEAGRGERPGDEETGQQTGEDLATMTWEEQPEDDVPRASARDAAQEGPAGDAREAAGEAREAGEEGAPGQGEEGRADD